MIRLGKIDKIMLLVYGSFLVDMAFNLVPIGPKKDFFPFFDGYIGWDGTMTFQTYIHKLFGHVSRMMMTAAWIIDTRRAEIKVIFWIQFVDMVDFILCYSYRWFYILGFSVEFNDVTFVLITMLIIQTLWKRQQLSS